MCISKDQQGRKWGAPEAFARKFYTVPQRFDVAMQAHVSVWMDQNLK